MGHGVGSLVGESEKSLFDSLGFENLLGLSMEGEERSPERIILHFDIRPLDTLAKAHSNGFEKGLLGCKSSGEAFGGAGSVLTPDDFSLGKEPTQEEVSPTSHHTFDPFNTDDVDAISNNHKFGVISYIVN
jgi:hypothetical protein